MRLILIITTLAVCISCSAQNGHNTSKQSKPPINLNQYKTAYFASGCFWCVEAVFESVNGVVEAESGYAGGQTLNPTYQSIGTGRTGHSETVKVYYDPKIVDFKTLLQVYYGSHNPFTVNGQHPDYGSQYRSIIFYQNDDEQKLAEQVKNAIDEQNDESVATEIIPFSKFYKAEDYHQDYERLHPNQSYVKSVSIPRLNRFKKAFPHLLKPEAKLKE